MSVGCEGKSVSVTTPLFSPELRARTVLGDPLKPFKGSTQTNGWMYHLRNGSGHQESHPRCLVVVVVVHR